MSTTRIKEKLSTLVSSQLPEFIQTDYTTFKAFLEAYYEFLEQDQNAQELLQNARSYNDIDRTVDSFVEYFLKQYCNDIPREVLYNKKALVKNIQDLYQTKGSEKSYNLLFRILYNKDVEIFYPSSQVLKASDGKWIQKTSFFMRTIVGDGASIVGKNTFILSSTTKFPIYIESKRQALSSTGPSTTVFEYFFDNSKNIPISVGDVIEYGGFKGEVVGVPSTVSVSAPGSGFKVGEILTLTSGQGQNAKVKITKVNSTGGILNVQLISFGIGYTGDFYNFFSSSQGIVTPTSFNFAGGVATITDNLSGFVERGTIIAPSYAVTGYYAEDYTGDILREFFTSTSSTGLTPAGTMSGASGQASDAALYVSIGSKVKYPGYYENIDGFLSDNIYLEDQNYYQPFSYVVKIDERLSLYKKAVLDILHPAGTKLFGELSLNASIDISSEIVTTIRFLTNHFQDVFGEVEDANSKHVGKNVSDTVGNGEEIYKLVIKPLENNTEVADELYRLLTRPISDEISATLDSDAKDVNKKFGDEGGSVYSPDYFLEDYTEAVEYFVVLDSVSTSVINNQADNVSTTDSGSILIASYAEPGYFAEDYAGESSVF